MAVYSVLNTNISHGSMDSLNPAWMSFTRRGKCVPIKMLLCIIFNILSKSACLGKYLCTKLLLFPCIGISGEFAGIPFLVS